MSTAFRVVALAIAMLAVTTAAQARTGTDPMPTAAERTVLSACRAALADAALAETVRREIERQVRTNPPFAFIDGYWVTPVNVTGLLRTTAVRAALADVANDADEMAQAERILDREARLPRLVGLAFIPRESARSLDVPHADELEPSNGGAVSGTGLHLVLLRDLDQVVIEYLPPPDVGIDPIGDECRFFCGDPSTWDFDDDGIPNGRDDDDDDDGVIDARDAYPFWPAAASCDCGEHRFTAFTEQFSAGVTRTVLRARAWIDEPARMVAIRPAGGTDSAAHDIRVVFPTPGIVPAETVEFVMGREGGLCVTKTGGTLCRAVITVRDDGTWDAIGVLPPAPARGTVVTGAASRLATMLEDGWDTLTAHPFTGTCPSAYDGQELWYAVRRIPAGGSAGAVDDDVRELRACVYDLGRPAARDVLGPIEAAWRKLGVPGFEE